MGWDPYSDKNRFHKIEPENPHHGLKIIIYDSSGGEYAVATVWDHSFLGSGRTDDDAMESLVAGLREAADKIEAYLAKKR